MYNFPFPFPSLSFLQHKRRRHVLPWQLPYTWSGFVWVHIVIINCHVANSREESLPVLIVLLKSADETHRQSRSITGTLPMQSPFYPLPPHTHTSSPPSCCPGFQCQHAASLQTQLVHLLWAECIMHLIGALQLRVGWGRRVGVGVGGGGEGGKGWGCLASPDHFSPFVHCQD